MTARRTRPRTSWRRTSSGTLACELLAFKTAARPPHSTWGSGLRRILWSSRSTPTRSFFPIRSLNSFGISRTTAWPPWRGGRVSGVPAAASAACERSNTVAGQRSSGAPGKGWASSLFVLQRSGGGCVARALAISLAYWAAILPYAIATLVADAALTVFGLRLDRAPAKLAYDWIVFRTFYRWILFVALVRAAYAALRGGAVGWGKLVRKGTVRLQAHEVPH